MFDRLRRVVFAPVVLVLITGIAPVRANAAPLPEPTSISVSASPNPAWVGETVTLTFTVSPKPDGGVVSVNGAGGYPVDPATGQASTTMAWPIVGTVSFRATFLGTPSFAASPEITSSIVVRKHIVTVGLALPATPVSRGDPFDVALTFDEVPTGGLILINDITDVGSQTGPRIISAVADGTSPMTIHMPGLQPGTYHLRADYLGTEAYSSASSSTLTLDVADRPTTTTASIDPNPADWGQPATLHVQVSPIPDDGGGVRIWRGGSMQGWATMDWTTGLGTFEMILANPGDYPVTAEFLAAGSPGRYASSSAIVTEHVTSTPVDRDPPVASVTINGGDAITTDGYVVITTTSTDASSVSTRYSCDQATWTWTGTPNGDFGWGFGNPGCTSDQGVKTIYVEFTDIFGNTTIASDSIILENAGPSGTVILADGSLYVFSPDVIVDVPASDAGSGVAEVQLSNDGADWTTRPYAPTQAWTLSAGDGTKKVYTKWRDGYGNWSAAKSLTVVLDTIAPSATAPLQTIVRGGALVAGRVPVRLTWSGADGTSGIAGYELRQQTDGGRWSTLSTTLASPTTPRSLAPGHTYRFAILPRDHAGNIGPIYYGRTFRLTGVSQASSTIHYAGTWTSSTSSTWWGGTARSSTRSGSTATLSFTGRSIAWVSLKAPNRGRASIYVNGVLNATVDLGALSAQTQRIVWSASWSTSATRTITIRVLGTAGRPRVDLDGFVVAS